MAVPVPKPIAGARQQKRADGKIQWIQKIPRIKAHDSSFDAGHYDALANIFGSKSE